MTPYKVIDLREIAKEFNISLERIEADIADLIVNQKIQAKIDSHSKVGYITNDLTHSIVVILQERKWDSEFLQRSCDLRQEIYTRNWDSFVESAVAAEEKDSEAVS